MITTLASLASGMREIGCAPCYLICVSFHLSLVQHRLLPLQHKDRTGSYPLESHCPSRALAVQHDPHTEPEMGHPLCDLCGKPLVIFAPLSFITPRIRDIPSFPLTLPPLM